MPTEKKNTFKNNTEMYICEHNSTGIMYLFCYIFLCKILQKKNCGCLLEIYILVDGVGGSMYGHRMTVNYFYVCFICKVGEVHER